MAVSPDGRTVFVTGLSAGRASGDDYATAGYRAATGSQLWVTRYSGPGNGADSGLALAVSPDGAIVYVAGASTGKTSGSDAVTLAYRAATGRQLWLTRYTSPGSRSDSAGRITVSPGGSMVFVAGISTGKTSGEDYLTIACQG